MMFVAKVSIVALVILGPNLAVAGEAANTMTIDQMGAASGLARIISSADACSYQVDEDALAKYFSAVGLATPTVLSYISGEVSQNKKFDKPSPSECTLIKTTADAAHLLAK